MPLKMGVSADTVSSNIKEMMKSGRPQKQAIAAALSMKRKSKRKNMAEGGEASSYDDGMSIVGYNDLAIDHGEDIANPEHEEHQRMLAKHLHEMADKMDDDGYAMGGLVIGDEQTSMGSKPELDWINDGTEEPMSDEPAKPADLDHPVEDGVPMAMGALSEEAMRAIEEKKKKRRFTMR